MSESKTYIAAKLIFVICYFAIIFPFYGWFERKGFQAAGVVCSSLIGSTALLIFIYFSFIGKGWFRLTIASIILLNVLLTVASTKLNLKLSSAWMIPIVLFQVIALGTLIELIGRRFEGHSL